MEDSSRVLQKIKQLTTGTGIYQHGKLDKSDPIFGYALEDQARALIIAHEFGAKDLEEIYLSFIIRARNKDVFLNQYYYEDGRGFIEDTTPLTVLDRQETYGIALWALFSTNNFQNNKIKFLTDQICANTRLWVSPRAIAFALLGFSHLPISLPEQELVEKMCSLYRQVATKDWQWFENYLVYANAILPWAMWEIAISRKGEQTREIAEKSTRFLLETCQVNGIPCPIGNNNWYTKGGERAIYDQQPIDPAYMVCCLEKAFEATGNKYYLDWAEKWWKWFFGNNLNKTPVVTNDFSCYDGLSKEGLNKNQGAESNICFLLAYLAAKRLGIADL